MKVLTFFSAPHCNYCWVVFEYLWLCELKVTHADFLKVFLFHFCAAQFFEKYVLNIGRKHRWDYIFLSSSSSLFFVICTSVYYLFWQWKDSLSISAETFCVLNSCIKSWVQVVKYILKASHFLLIFWFFFCLLM